MYCLSLKKGDPKIPGNYRPVSLTSITCKLLEYIISSNVMRHLEGNDILYRLQHGFRKYKSVFFTVWCFLGHKISYNFYIIDTNLRVKLSSIYSVFVFLTYYMQTEIHTCIQTYIRTSTHTHANTYTNTHWKDVSDLFNGCFKVIETVDCFIRVVICPIEG